LLLSEEARLMSDLNVWPMSSEAVDSVDTVAASLPNSSCEAASAPSAA